MFLKNKQFLFLILFGFLISVTQVAFAKAHHVNYNNDHTSNEVTNEPNLAIALYSQGLQFPQIYNITATSLTPSFLGFRISQKTTSNTTDTNKHCLPIFNLKQNDLRIILTNLILIFDISYGGIKFNSPSSVSVEEPLPPPPVPIPLPIPYYKLPSHHYADANPTFVVERSFKNEYNNSVIGTETVHIKFNTWQDDNIQDIPNFISNAFANENCNKLNP